MLATYSGMARIICLVENNIIIKLVIVIAKFYLLQELFIKLSASVRKRYNIIIIHTICDTANVMEMVNPSYQLAMNIVYGFRKTNIVGRPDLTRIFKG